MLMSKRNAGSRSKVTMAANPQGRPKLVTKHKVFNLAHQLDMILRCVDLSLYTDDYDRDRLRQAIVVCNNMARKLLEDSNADVA